MINELELKKIIDFFKILKTIDSRINLDSSSASFKRHEDKTKNAREKLHRNRRNK